MQGDALASSALITGNITLSFSTPTFTYIFGLDLWTAVFRVLVCLFVYNFYIIRLGHNNVIVKVWLD